MSFDLLDLFLLVDGATDIAFTSTSNNPKLTRNEKFVATAAVVTVGAFIVYKHLEKKKERQMKNLNESTKTPIVDSLAGESRWQDQITEQSQRTVCEGACKCC